MENFLKYLETDGGKLLVILFMLVFMLGTLSVLILMGHPPQEAGERMVSGAVGLLLGILIQYLKPAGK
jgi:hypothetical protein